MKFSLRSWRCWRYSDFSSDRVCFPTSLDRWKDAPETEKKTWKMPGVLDGIFHSNLLVCCISLAFCLAFCGLIFFELRSNSRHDLCDLRFGMEESTLYDPKGVALQLRPNAVVRTSKLDLYSSCSSYPEVLHSSSRPARPPRNHTGPCWCKCH